MTLPEVTEEMKIKYADAVKANTPRNGVSKREYTGENAYRLIDAQLAKGFTDNRWYTFNQLQSIGARIKKGEHGTKIWGWWYRKSDDAEMVELTEEEAKAVHKVHPKIHVLFNAEQCTGISTAPEAVATIEETEGKKYTNVIKGSFEIKPKAKKAKKAEAKAPEAVKLPDAIEAPEGATEETKKRYKASSIIFKAFAIFRKIARIYDGKVLDTRTWEAFVDALAPIAGNDYKFHFFKGCDDVRIYFIDDWGTCHYVFYRYGTDEFVTKEEGKKPRFNAAGFLAIVDKEEERMREELKKFDDAIAKEKRMKELLAIIDAAQKEARQVSGAALISQGMEESDVKRLRGGYLYY